MDQTYINLIQFNLRIHLLQAIKREPTRTNQEPIRAEPINQKPSRTNQNSLRTNQESTKIT